MNVAKFVATPAFIARHVNPELKDDGNNDGCNSTADPKDEQRLPDWEGDCENAADYSSNAIADCDDDDESIHFYQQLTFTNDPSGSTFSDLPVSHDFKWVFSHHGNLMSFTSFSGQVSEAHGRKLPSVRISNDRIETWSP